MIGLAMTALAASSCSLPVGANHDAGSQTSAFAIRSVEIVALAAAGDERKLSVLIAPSAEFSLGSGDVGRPMGTGVAGAYALARDLKAATYIYNGWDYIPMDRDACGPQEVEVEFVNSAGDMSAKIKFKYEAGVLKSASGWWRTRNAGAVRLEATNG